MAKPKVAEGGCSRSRAEFVPLSPGSQEAGDSRPSQRLWASVILRGPRCTPSPTLAGYLSPKAQLVDGVLGFSILGEELVVVLLWEKQSQTVTCPDPSECKSSAWGLSRPLQAHMQ